MIAKGKYPGRCVSKALKETKGGKAFVELGFEVTGGAHLGEFIVWKGWLSERAYERTEKVLRLVGWTGKRVDDLSGISDQVTVSLVIDHEEYPEGSGTYHAVVKFVNDPRGDAVSTDRAKQIADEIEARGVPF